MHAGMNGFVNRMKLYAELMRLNRPTGILLLLWPTLWALWFAAEGMPSWHPLIVFVAGVVLMRSAGCVVNDYADRALDPQVTRTKHRPLADGRISPREALWLFAALCMIAFTLVLMLDRRTILLSFVAVALAALYPFMKRYTHWPQVFLGLAFGMGIPMAFAALNRDEYTLPAILFAANLCWVIAYDTAYAMVDRDDDLKAGIRSTAILFGRYDRLAMGCCYVAALGLLALAGRQAGRGILYHAGLLAAGGVAIYTQRLIHHRVGADCFRAFLLNSWFGAAVFAGLALDYAF